LNKLPEVKRFVKEDGHANSYDGLTVNYVPGKKPELICFQDDEEIDRIDLAGYTTDGLHTLVKEKGFKQIQKAQEEL